MSLSEFEEQLIRSTNADVPDAARRATSRARVMRAAGFVTVGITIGGPAGTAVASNGPVVTPAAATMTKGLIVTKVVALTAVIAAGSAGAFALSQPQAVVQVSSNAMPRRPASTPSSVSETAMVPKLPLPVASDPPKVSRAAATSSAQSNSGRVTPDPLAVEVVLLSAARSCVAASDLTCAEDKLAEYDARFRRGVLEDESSIIRIELALKRGARSQARELAADLLRRHPSGPYVKRAQKVLAAGDGK